MIKSVILGQNGIVHPATVIGADGFVNLNSDISLLRVKANAPKVIVSTTIKMICLTIIF